MSTTLGDRPWVAAVYGIESAIVEYSLESAPPKEATAINATAAISDTSKAYSTRLAPCWSSVSRYMMWSSKVISACPLLTFEGRLDCSK